MLRVDIKTVWHYTSSMKSETVAKHLALVSTLAGALATALSYDPLNIVLLNLGAILYLYWSLKVRDWNLVAVNGGLLLIYIVGAVIRI